MGSLGYMERPCLKKAKSKAESTWKGEDVGWGRGDADQAIRPQSHVHAGLRTDTALAGHLCWWEQLMHTVSIHKVHSP